MKLGTTGAALFLTLNAGNVYSQESKKIKGNGQIIQKLLKSGNNQKIITHTNSDQFVPVFGEDNPFSGSSPIKNNLNHEGWADFVDLDNDGDLDVVQTTDDPDYYNNLYVRFFRKCIYILNIFSKI